MVDMSIIAAILEGSLRLTRRSLGLRKISIEVGYFTVIYTCFSMSHSANPLNRFHVRENLKILANASESLSEALQTLQELTKVIERPCLDLAVSYRRVRNNTHPFMQLPFEIIGSIFEIACLPVALSPTRPPDFSRVVRCQKTRLAVGYTCFYFRHVLLKSRAAWDHIPVLIDGKLDPLHETRDLLPVGLARASQSAVHLYISIKNARTTRNGRFMKAWESLCATVVSLRSRLRTLFIMSDQTPRSPVVLNWISAERIFPDLKYVYIEVQGLLSAASLDLRGFPAAEVLHVKYITSNPAMGRLSITPSTNSFIRELSLHGSFNAGDTLSLLQSFQSSIEAFHWISDKKLSDELPRPPSLASRLPRLQALHLEISHPFSFLDASRFEMSDHHANDGVSNIVLPSLHSCKIGHYYCDKICLSSFFKNNPTIRIIKTRAHAPTIANLFEAAASSSGSADFLPNLEVLHNRNKVNSLRELKPWFESTRARKSRFAISLEVPDKDFDKEVSDQYLDVLRIRSWTT
ncbi:hypothetical protein DL93DRAFT_2101917 [Clavulina sp. PMI_390]|nr:hypothetical protein DL93DRAFT_2101917 [Clavulina sp. PMI_390]